MPINLSLGSIIHELSTNITRVRQFFSEPGVHRIAALLKRVLLSTHQGAVRVNILIIILMNTLLGLIAEPQDRVGYFSTGLWNKR